MKLFAAGFLLTFLFITVSVISAEWRPQFSVANHHHHHYHPENGEPGCWGDGPGRGRGPGPGPHPEQGRGPGSGPNPGQERGSPVQPPQATTPDPEDNPANGNVGNDGDLGETKDNDDLINDDTGNEEIQDGELGRMQG